MSTFKNSTLFRYIRVVDLPHSVVELPLLKFGVESSADMGSILEMMVKSEIGIDYLKKGIIIDKFWIGIEVSYKKIKFRN